MQREAMDPSIVTPELRRKLAGTFPMGPRSIHGPAHWARVLVNALRVSRETGADPRVLALFSVFHDSLRQNDAVDPDHGLRGAEHARRLRAEGWFEIEDEAFERVYEACARHTDGDTSGHPDLITCWDGDRLDLWRCGIVPDPERMCTATARSEEVIRQAMQRSGGPPDGKVRVFDRPADPAGPAPGEPAPRARDDPRTAE